MYSQTLLYKHVHSSFTPQQQLHTGHSISKVAESASKGRKGSCVETIMATHVLLVDDSCVDRMVASRVFEFCNVKGNMTSMNFSFAFYNKHFMIYCFIGSLNINFTLLENQDL